MVGVVGVVKLVAVHGGGFVAWYWWRWLGGESCWRLRYEMVVDMLPVWHGGSFVVWCR